MVTQEASRREGNYFRVLERQTRILGDYEQVHFRKSMVVPQGPRYTSTPISIAPRRPSRPQYVHFNKSNAAFYLRQTEALWMHPDLSRQEATKLLLDRAIGSFIVRNSQRARYALSLRVQNEETAVRHFLIQNNQQNFLTIQGSNLPFVSIYDLLVYFCFHQSGGMPCCLKPPKPDSGESRLEGSESSESDSEGDHEEGPPQLPPRTPSMMNLKSPSVEQSSRELRDSIIHNQQPDLDERKEIVKKKQPPPKPPRPAMVWGGDDSDEEGLEAENSHHVAPHSQFDSNPRSSSITPTPAGSDISKPHLLRRRSKSSDCIRKRNDANSTHKETQSADIVSLMKQNVSTLIEMFEAKSPNSSPVRQSWNINRKGSRSVPTNGFNSGPLQKNDTAHKNFPAPDSPIPPPKPRVTAPPLPPRPLSSADYENGRAPIVPPRTPAPILPPKPPGSLPPSVHPRFRHRRSLSSDSKPIPNFEDTPPPKLPPKRKPRLPGYEVMPLPGTEAAMPSESGYADSENVESNQFKASSLENLNDSKLEVGQREPELSGFLGDNMMIGEVDVTTKGWQIVSNTTGGSDMVENTASGNKGQRRRAKKPLGWAKKLQFRAGKRKPRKKLRKCILELAADQSQEFGRKISEFITDIKSRSTEPHQKMLLEIRTFITAMHEYLLQHHQNELNESGMEGCDNSGHVLECALQECILQPLSHFVYLRIEEYYATNGYLFQVQRSIHQGKLKTPEEIGIRPHLIVPSEKAIADMTTVFNRMMKTTCAISKLEYLLEVVRQTYENIKDSRQPKKPTNDLGADDFLPIFVWVLLQCEFTRAEIEAEYMWGLAHPSLFNGEGGYYLTTLTSAINVLKELTTPPPQTTPQAQLPTMNNLQTELKVYFEDEHTGQYSSAYYLPIVPTMTVAEICEIIEERRQITNPKDYALFTVVNGKALIMEDHVKPQEIKFKWTLERSLEQSLNSGKVLTTPSSQFFAYKLRTPGSIL